METTQKPIALPSEDPELALPEEQPRPHSESESLVIRLFDQFQGRVLRYVLACGLPFHDAEDIVQETFLSLFRHLERGRPRSNLNGWLFRVAHNLALKRRGQIRNLDLPLSTRTTWPSTPARGPMLRRDSLSARRSSACVRFSRRFLSMISAACICALRD